ncbi:MAG: hypothetical protein AAF602_14630 [Myxococcota bacterium]
MVCWFALLFIVGCAGGRSAVVEVDEPPVDPGAQLVKVTTGDGVEKFVVAPTPPPELPTVVLEILPGGFELRASGVVRETLPCRIEGCAHEPADIQSVREAYDFAALRALASRIVDSGTTKRTAIIVPHVDTTYVVLLEAMDTLRSDPTVDNDDDCDGRCLFPAVIIAPGRS